MTTHVHIIEHTGMTGELSAVTPRAQQYAGCMQTFRDQASFRAARVAVERCMLASPGDGHMVVICTHGCEDTGTWLDMGDDDAYPVLDKLFANVPENTLIYMAVCWGGYAAVITRAQGGGTSKPVVVGALAPLTGDEGNQLQDALLDVLVSHGVDEERLERAVTEFNTRMEGEYGQPTARIARRDGRLVPPPSTAGIAWALLRHPNDTPNEGPFCVEELTEQHAIVRDSGGKTWTAHVGWMRQAKGRDVSVGDRFSFKAKQQPDGEVLKVMPPARFLP
jgi:hypothetical protein